MHKYRLVAKKGEGTFSEVLKAQSVVTGDYFAVKCMKSKFKSLEQVHNLREIQALKRLNPHPHIIEMEEILFDAHTGRLALVFELMECNIYELIRNRKQYLKAARVKNLMYQLLKAVAHMHKNGIFHRDIKPENILILGDKLKVADFGSCRGMYSKPPFTEYISTRWYRAPECLLTNGHYDFKMDIWGIGCVFFEIVSLVPLFPGENEVDQIQQVHKIMGTPNKEVLSYFRKKSPHANTFDFSKQTVGTGLAHKIPHATKECIDLIEQLLIYHPAKRITAKQALQHPYFRDLREAEQRERIRTASPVLMKGPKVKQPRNSNLSVIPGLVSPSDAKTSSNSSNTKKKNHFTSTTQQRAAKRESAALPSLAGKHIDGAEDEKAEHTHSAKHLPQLGGMGGKRKPHKQQKENNQHVSLVDITSSKDGQGQQQAVTTNNTVSPSKLSVRDRDRDRGQQKPKRRKPKKTMHKSNSKRRGLHANNNNLTTKYVSLVNNSPTKNSSSGENYELVTAKKRSHRSNANNKQATRRVDRERRIRERRERERRLIVRLEEKEREKELKRRGREKARRQQYAKQNRKNIYGNMGGGNTSNVHGNTSTSIVHHNSSTLAQSKNVGYTRRKQAAGSLHHNQVGRQQGRARKGKLAKGFTTKTSRALGQMNGFNGIQGGQLKPAFPTYY